MLVLVRDVVVSFLFLAGTEVPGWTTTKFTNHMEKPSLLTKFPRIALINQG